jgi:hypothetical protein
MPSLSIVTNGRPDLAGPLAQLCLGRDGTFFVVAAGRANHAGEGSWRGITTGNSSFVGIEAENTGAQGDPWPAVQIDAYRRGVAALLKRIDAGAEMCCGHKEFALPAGRKKDPTFDMDDFRKHVAAIIAGSAPPPTLIPAVDAEGRPTLRRGARGDLVRQIQKKLNVDVDGVFGSATEAALRQFQRAKGLVPDGIVGPQTWVALGSSTTVAAIPDPTSRPIGQITRIAAASHIARFSWKDRGIAPAGYIKGMAVAYARVYCKLKARDVAAVEMAKPQTADADRDALTWYSQIFAGVGMSNDRVGVDTLRHLFVLLIGLGMRESSGKYCEGRDKSASNTTAETAEAGLFQTSFNAVSASPILLQLFTQYLAKPNGFVDVFKEGVHCGPDSFENFGTGDGMKFQRLSKECPAFAAEFAAVGLRHVRTHWGPINRREAEVRPECDEMLQQVQNAVDRSSEISSVLA